VQGRGLFEVNRDAALDAGAVHLGVKIDRGRDDQQIEFGAAGVEHRQVVGEDLHAAPVVFPLLLLRGEFVGLRVAGADEAGLGLGLELQHGGLMHAGEAAHADDTDAKGSGHTILSFGRSWPSTRPTGLPLGSTAMRSSILWASNSRRASTPSASAVMVLGLRVMKSATGRERKSGPVNALRRKSPSVRMPVSLPVRGWTRAMLPLLALVMRRMASWRLMLSGPIGRRSPERMMSLTRRRSTRPRLPAG